MQISKMESINLKFVSFIKTSKYLRAEVKFLLGFLENQGGLEKWMVKNNIRRAFTLSQQD